MHGKNFTHVPNKCAHAYLLFASVCMHQWVAGSFMPRQQKAEEHVVRVDWLFPGSSFYKLNSKT